MKKKVLVSSIMIIALCACIIAGSTFALFTSTTQLNVAVTAGNVSVIATIQENSLRAYSGEWDAAADDYKSVEVFGTTALDKTFTNGGTVIADADKNEIVIDKITPMDKIEFVIDVTNYSDVTIKYRTVIKTDAKPSDDGVTLLDALEITIDGTDTMGQVDANTKASAWSVWAPADDVAAGETKSINVVIEFPNGDPEYDNLFQGLTAGLTYTVEAVQGNGHTVDDISSILAAAPAGSTVELPAEDFGTMTINNTLTDVTIDFAKVENVDEIIIGADADLNNVIIKNVAADTDFYTSQSYKNAFIKIQAGANVNNLVIESSDFTSTSGKRDVAIYNAEPTASVYFSDCTFSGIGYVFWTDRATFADLTFDGCTFSDNQSWVIMHNKTPYDGNLTIMNCTFENCKKGLVKLTSANTGEMTVGSIFTFIGNTINNCNGNNGNDASLFLVDADTATVIATGNTRDGADWNPGADHGIK